MRSAIDQRRWRSAPGTAGAVLAIAAGATGAFARPIQPPAVTNPEALIPWIHAAATGRADLVGIGDSNQLHSGAGWDHGITKALSERFGLYATSLLATGENGGNGAGSGYGYGVVGGGATSLFQPTGAPSWLNARMAPSVAMYPLNYMYLPAGQVSGANNFYGLYLDQGSPVDVNGGLRFTVIHGAFPAGSGGVFRLFVRNPNPPYQAFAETNIQSNGFGAPYGILTSELFVPAAARNTAMYFRLGRIDENVTGPFMLYYMRAENQDKSVGTSHHTLYAFGGRTAFDMALALNAADDSYLSLFFSGVRALQGTSPRVLVRINSGANDRNETRPSYSNFLLPGYSQQAFADNVGAIMDRIGEIWTLNGWPAEELFFLVTVTHPVSNPDDVKFEEYRAAAAGLATQRPRVAAVNLGVLTSWNEGIANNWYPYGGFDTNHLLQPGYEVIGKRELTALEAGRCWRDLNADRQIDIEDLYAWHAARPDLNGDAAGNFTDERCLGAAIRYGEGGDVSAGRGAGLLLP